MSRPRKTAVVALGGVALVALGWVSHAGTAASNLFLKATADYYFIPAESAVNRFRVTRWNDGSGDWWLYGEDDHFFYAISDDDPDRYHLIARSDLQPGMDPLDKATWGAAARLGTVPGA